MLLVADIGNTSITVGIYRENSLIASWKLASDKIKSEDEYGIILYNLVKHKELDEKLEGAIISSVVLPLTERFKNAIEKYLGVSVLVVSSKINLGIILDVENPKEVGGDRIVNACAAYKLYKTPAVVVDFGTTAGVLYNL